MISTLSFLLELLQLLHRLFVRSKHCFPPQQNEKCVLNNEYHRAVIKYVYTLLAKQNLFGLFEKRFEEDSGLKKSYQMFYRVAQKAQLLFFLDFFSPAFSQRCAWRRLVVNVGAYGNDRN